MYLARDPRHSDVRSLYSGIRPLVRASGDKGTFVGEVAWAARREMARTVEDVLARRTRALLLDARASMEAAPQTAAILAAELGRNEGWCRDQVEAYRTLAAGYVLG